MQEIRLGRKVRLHAIFSTHSLSMDHEAVITTGTHHAITCAYASDFRFLQQPGLENGVTYFFAVSAVSSTGIESELSNEISYLPGIHKTALHTTATGEVVVTVRGLIGQRYEIEAAGDLETWTLISTVTVGESGSLQFTDPQAANFPKRFYRTREAP